jgi:hypothetical protein
MGFSRSPLAILLAIVSAALIIIGRINSAEWWGIWAAIGGFALLIVAAAVAFRATWKAG